MILADSSAWIEYDRATRSSVDRRMTELIATGGQLAVTEPVRMEVLAGVGSDEKRDDLSRLLQSAHLLRFDSIVDFDTASFVYRRCRRVGFTPRGMIDCMIAAVAWRCGAKLLAQDVDLDRVAAVMGIEMDPASARA